MKQNQSNTHDEELVNFLKTYSPTPPQENKPCEALVMKSIETTSLSLNQGWLKKGWLLSGTLITTLLIIGGYFWNVNLRSNSQFASDDVEKLEIFMVETWHGSMGTESELNFVTNND
ncbi:hypothetical protein [Geminocystis herdmanii]|uniref:hypothetical protein n=1 Tax=Geminocystis herdmanii TaxID=669359 RepID=UPI00034D3F1E|nr:hypothetical protein [Geminocystis herdmanii]